MWRQRKVILTNIFVNIIAFSACIYLLIIHLNFSGDFFCPLFGGNCSLVINSTYGSILSFPVATIGLSYFSTMIYLSLFQLLKFNNVVSYTTIYLNLLASIISIIFIATMIFVLKENCTICNIIHTINFINLTLAFKIHKSYSFEYSSKNNYRRTLIIALAIGVNIFLLSNLIESKFKIKSLIDSKQRTVDFYNSQYQKSPYIDFEINDDDIVYAQNGHGLHTITIIYKKSCKHCQRAIEILKKFTISNQDTFALILKNYDSIQTSLKKKLDIKKVPAIYIDGKYTDGWESSDFMNNFTDCGDCI